jgi:hypothetical protein
MPPRNPFGSQGNDLNAGPPSINVDQINALLAPYGVQMPSQYMQPGPFENMGGFFQGHPTLSRGLDNALIAVGNMGPTGRTAGENISNAARGVLSIGPYRRQFAAEQALMPLEFANKVGALQAQQGLMKFHEAMGEYYRNRGSASVVQAENRLNSALVRENLQGAQHMQMGKDAMGRPVVMEPQVGDDLKVHWVENHNIDPAVFQQELTRQKVTSRFGGGAVGGQIANAIAQHYGGWDKIPDVVDPKVYSDAAKEANKDSASYLGREFGAANVPQADVYKSVHQASTDYLKGAKWPITNYDSAVKAESARLLAGMLDSGGVQNPLQARQQADQQAAINVRGRMTTNSQLDAAYGTWSQLPVETQMTVPFAQWLQSDAGGRWNPNTRAFAGPTAPPQAQAGPMPGQPAPSPSQGLSPQVQAIIGTLAK